MERGCARSVSRSAFKLLRLVCGTAALRQSSAKAQRRREEFYFLISGSLRLCG